MSKTILITGSTDGIGKLTALKLAENGHQVYIHGRNENKVSNVIEEIKSATKNQKVFGFIADFSDLKQILNLSFKIKNEIDQLDVLINNAGVFKSATQKNDDGLDLRFVVNYFAPYILTQELTPTLNKSDSPRIISLSSAAQSEVSLKALEGNTDLTTQEAYAQSKLALTMWSFNYAKNHKNINTIAVNPGSLLNTKMVKEAYGNHWSSADKGANILYDLATFEKFNDKSGSYFDNDRGDFNNAHPDAYNEEKINSLLSTTETILGKLV
ncbi:SDR family NAD(P)-dependent oxidoreductase [uncultured Tenacibaculum sp.]|uniref:SDR family NAD(P)-dependent oxidoreductase n=1 Tax=uncultured Tenacibaculum sp. TaxID=174713 RepID=UPI00262603AC|nr:SDR family NAD(P)-dependent oxidoreductase [uncultured Tenacibaculum sp.]